MLNSQSENVFYVAVNGDDDNNGSKEYPWRSITNSIAKLSPGDTLIIGGGTYRESVRITKSGSPQNYITIKNNPGEEPIIDGTGNDGNGLVISASYLNMSGLTILNWPENGVWVESSQFIEFRNINVSEVYYGIGFGAGSHDFILKDCKVSKFALYGFDVSPSGGEDCYNAYFEDCVAYSGSDPEQNVDGFATGHGDQSGFTFIDCLTYGVYDGFDISSDDTILVGCLSFNCGNAGYKIWGDNITLMNCIGYGSNNNLELDWSGSPKTVSVIHSDFVKSDTFNIWVENKRDKLLLFNSVVVSGENIGLCFEDGFSETYSGDYNIFQNHNPERFISIEYEKEYSGSDIKDGVWTIDTGQDTHSLVIEDVNVLFRDIDELDLYPNSSSPLIDSANDSVSISYDFESRLRPNGESSDIGAYEYYEDESTARKVDYKIKIPEIIQPDEESSTNNAIPLAHVPLLTIIAIFLFRRNYLGLKSD